MMWAFTHSHVSKNKQFSRLSLTEKGTSWKTHKMTCSKNAPCELNLKQYNLNTQCCGTLHTTSSPWIEVNWTETYLSDTLPTLIPVQTSELCGTRQSQTFIKLCNIMLPDKQHFNIIKDWVLAPSAQEEQLFSPASILSLPYLL